MSVFDVGAIDLHSHFLPPSYRQVLADCGVHHPDGMPTPFPDWSAESALDIMERVGIATAFMSVSSPGVLLPDGPAATDVARIVNDEGAEASHFSGGRLQFLTSLPLPDIDASLAEIDRAHRLGASGVSLLTNYAGRYLDEPSFEPIFAELDRRASLVVLHPTSPPQAASLTRRMPATVLEFHFDTTRAVIGLVLAGVLDRHPRIRVVVPHGGAVLPLVVDRVDGIMNGPALQGGHPRVDVAGALRRMWFDLAGDVLPRALPALLSVVDASRLVYGTDAPFTPAQRVVDNAQAVISTHQLTGPALRMVLRDNAGALLHRPTEL